MQGRVHRWVAAAAVATVLTAVPACAGAPTETSSADRTTPAAAVSAQPPVPRHCGQDDALERGVHVARHLDVGGVERSYKEYLPASYGTTAAPVVIQLHGYLSGADGQIAMSAIESTAEAGGFVVLSPQGTGAHPFWNAVPHADLPDDVGFVRTLIDDVVAQRCVDPARVYVVGMSNGAFLASRVACDLADRVAGVAAVAGLLDPQPCSPARPVPVLAVHGTGDRFVPADGSHGPALDTLAWDPASTRAFEGVPWAPVRSSVAAWATRNGCQAAPVETQVAAAVTKVAHGSCRDGADVVLYEVDGGGHTWPGSRFSAASAPVLGATTTEIDADAVMWDFLREHHR